MKSVRKRQVGVQNRLLCFVSRAGGVSHPHKTVTDMDGLINPYCTCSYTGPKVEVTHLQEHQDAWVCLSIISNR